MIEDTEDPTTEELAKLSSDSYISQEEPYYKNLGYKKYEDLSTKDINTYNHEQKNHWVITHRGTDIHGEDKLNQLKADVKILQGDVKSDNLHRKRGKDTENIVKSIREKYDSKSPIHLTGHSLGGSTIQNTLIKKPYVLENIKSFNSFNPGTSPIFKSTIKKNSKKYKEIYEKSTHHLIKDDPISENTHNTMIGKIKRYSNKEKPTITKRIFNALQKLSFISPISALGHWAGMKIVNTAQNHSIKNFL